MSEIDHDKLRTEAVDHPTHYGGDTVYEVVKVAEAWGLDKDAYLFNVLKYVARAEHKGKMVEDLEKGRWYLDRRIAQLRADK
jgi:hypothetical protein